MNAPRQYFWMPLLLAVVLWLAVPMRSPANDDIHLSDYGVELQEGTLIPAILQEKISTENGIVGQPVSALVAQDIYIGTKKVLSRSDRIFGRITRLEAPFKGRNAILRIDFDTLMLSSGGSLSFPAAVQTAQKDHYWGGELTPGTKPEIIPYNVYRIGTYGRVMYDGPRAMGSHVTLLPGERFMLTLQEPVELYAF